MHKRNQLAALIIPICLPAILAAQEGPSFQIDQEKRRPQLEIRRPAGPPLRGKVMEVDLTLGKVVILGRRFQAENPQLTTIFLSRDTKLPTKHGLPLALGELLAPGSIVSVEYYLTDDGSKKVATEMSRVESSEQN